MHRFTDAEVRELQRRGLIPAETPAVGELLRDIGAARRENEAADEKAFQADVVKLAKRNGWRCFHVTNPLKSAPGWPDLVLVGPRVLFRELKTETGRVSPAQEEWLADLTAAGVDAGVWKPSDWAEILRTLQ